MDIDLRGLEERDVLPDRLFTRQVQEREEIVVDIDDAQVVVKDNDEFSGVTEEGGERDPAGERVHLCHPEGTHVHLAGDEQDIEVSPDRVLVLLQRFRDSGYTHSFGIFLEKSSDGTKFLLVVLHHGDMV